MVAERQRKHKRKLGHKEDFSQDLPIALRNPLEEFDLAEMGMVLATPSFVVGL